MQNSKTFLLVLLGILAAFGPFVTDMYLPGFTFYDRLFRYNGFYGAIGDYDSYAGIGIRTDNRRPFER